MYCAPVVMKFMLGSLGLPYVVSFALFNFGIIYLEITSFRCDFMVGLAEFKHIIYLNLSVSAVSMNQNVFCTNMVHLGSSSEHR